MRAACCGWPRGLTLHGQVPRTGVLELDYVSPLRPPKGAVPVSFHVLTHLCQRFKLLPRQMSKIRAARRAKIDLETQVLRR